jgi:hypothetical protein
MRIQIVALQFGLSKFLDPENLIEQNVDINPKFSHASYRIESKYI